MPAPVQPSFRLADPAPPAPKRRTPKRRQRFDPNAHHPAEITSAAPCRSVELVAVEALSTGPTPGRDRIFEFAAHFRRGPHDGRGEAFTINPRVEIEPKTIERCGLSDVDVAAIKQSAPMRTWYFAIESTFAAAERRGALVAGFNALGSSLIFIRRELLAHDGDVSYQDRVHLIDVMTLALWHMPRLKRYGLRDIALALDLVCHPPRRALERAELIARVAEALLQRFHSGASVADVVATQRRAHEWLKEDARIFGIFRRDPLVHESLICDYGNQRGKALEELSEGFLGYLLTLDQLTPDARRVILARRADLKIRPLASRRPRT